MSVAASAITTVVQGRRDRERWGREQAADHERWLREQRLAAYLDVVRTADRYSIRASRTGALSEDIQNALASVRLLGPEAVLDSALRLYVAADKHATATAEPDANPEATKTTSFDLNEKRQAVVKAARDALGILE
ncbi:hypothetical protein [Mesorhizobium japonicum]|uniref:hypothetical protein n=1 Tax=Mesorhizobium japonicum TaxID=2066070 RepID=UPI003B5CFD33